MFLDTFELLTVERNLEKMSAVDLPASSFKQKFNDWDKNEMDKFKKKSVMTEDGRIVQKSSKFDKKVSCTITIPSYKP